MSKKLRRRTPIPTAATRAGVMSRPDPAIQQAMAHHRAGQLALAIVSYRQLLAKRKSDPNLLHLLGLALVQSGKPEEGIDLIRQAVRLAPKAADFRGNLAAAAGSLGRHDEAAEELRAVLKLQPGNVHALNNLGAALEHLERFEESVQVLCEAVARAPGFAEAWANLSHALRKSCGMGVSPMDGADSSEAPATAGTAVPREGGLTEALEAARRAVALKRDLPEAWHAAGAVLQQLGEPAALEEAIYCHRQAIGLKPDLAAAHVSLALCLLLKGELAEGFREYEWRRGEDCRFARSRAVAVSAPFCDLQLNSPIANPKLQIANSQHSAPSTQHCSPTGRPAIDLAGKTILLSGEGGLGNVIHFVRYAPIVARWAESVIVECHPALVPLLRRVKGIGEVIAQGDQRPIRDLTCPLMSLPALLGTTLETVPADVPYIEPEEQRVERWRSVIDAETRGRGEDVGVQGSGFRARGPAFGKNCRSANGEVVGSRCFRSLLQLNSSIANPKSQIANPPHSPLSTQHSLRIGITWQGEQRTAYGRSRSIPLGHFAVLALVPGVRLVSLQREEPTDCPFPLVTLAGLDRDGAFLDTSAVIRCLDLVITCDTSMAHLAGALGAPVWVAVGHVPDWRWMLDREDSPWYPTMRLFRQHSPGDWSGVFERMSAELKRVP